MPRVPTDCLTPNRPAARRGMTVLLMALTASGGALGDDGRVKVAPREPWANVFGAAQADFHFDVTGADRPGLRAGWAFSVLGGKAAGGEAELAPTADGSSAVAVHLELPPVKDGVILPALLAVTVSEVAGGKALGSIGKAALDLPAQPIRRPAALARRAPDHALRPRRHDGRGIPKASDPFRVGSRRGRRRGAHGGDPDRRRGGLLHRAARPGANRWRYWRRRGCPSSAWPPPRDRSRSPTRARRRRSRCGGQT